MSFAAAEGNWHMKASITEGYDPVQTLAGLNITPPGLGHYRQAVPYGNLKQTLCLLRSDHWHWINPISVAVETDSF